MKKKEKKNCNNELKLTLKWLLGLNINLRRFNSSLVFHFLIFLVLLIEDIESLTAHTPEPKNFEIKIWNNRIDLKNLHILKKLALTEN